jgi:Fe-S-cluster containining protein
VTTAQPSTYDTLNEREKAWTDRACEVMVDEYFQTNADIAKMSHDGGAMTRRYYRRYEIVQEQTLQGAVKEKGDELACTKGCGYCCHHRVTAPAHELLTLAETIEKMPEAQRAVIIDRVHRNAERVEAMTQDEAFRTPMRCALLGEDNACMSYEDRPSTCRRYHSLSLKRCTDSFHDASNLRSKIPLSTPLLVNSEAQYMGFRRAISERGVDTRYYEMNTGLREALTGMDACAQRMQSGGPTFLRAARFDDPLAVTP